MDPKNPKNPKTPPAPALAPRPPRLSDRAILTSVLRVGARRQLFGDLYHSLLDASWLRFLTATLLLYVTVNAVFALAYLLGGDCIENARRGSFHDAFFFSVQTMATIGYGKLTPRTSYANVLVTLEALSGMLGTAMATGLMFAKFARPTARVLWSEVAVIAPRDGVTSLMFRMANERGNQIVEAQIRVVLARAERTREGEEVRRFYDLALARSQNATFALSWTAIHPITPASPLWQATAETLRAMDMSLIVSLVGIDETSAQTVHSRHTYVPEEIEWNMRFVDIISRRDDGRRVVNYTRFHDVVPLPQPPLVPSEPLSAVTAVSTVSAGPESPAPPSRGAAG